jgi:hypothetical protein
VSVNSDSESDTVQMQIIHSDRVAQSIHVDGEASIHPPYWSQTGAQAGKIEMCFAGATGKDKHDSLIFELELTDSTSRVISDTTQWKPLYIKEGKFRVCHEYIRDSAQLMLSEWFKQPFTAKARLRLNAAESTPTHPILVERQWDVNPHFQQLGLRPATARFYPDEIGMSLTYHDCIKVPSEPYRRTQRTHKLIGMKKLSAPQPTDPTCLEKSELTFAVDSVIKTIEPFPAEALCPDSLKNYGIEWNDPRFVVEAKTSIQRDTVCSQNQIPASPIWPQSVALLDVFGKNRIVFSEFTWGYKRLGHTIKAAGLGIIEYKNEGLGFYVANQYLVEVKYGDSTVFKR